MPDIDELKSALVIDRFFWASCLLQKPVILSDQVETAATDGLRYWFNPAYLASLTGEEGLGLLAHEVEHVARKDNLRRGNRDAKLWNRACDLRLNPDLLDAGFKLWPGALVDLSFKGLSAEEAYERLVQEASGGDGGGTGAQNAPQPGQRAPGQPGQPQPATSTPGQGAPGAPGAPGADPAASQGPPDSNAPPGPVGDCGGAGMVLDLPGAGGETPSEAEIAAAERDTNVMLTIAAAAAKARGAGHLPAHMRRWIEQQLRPRLTGWELLERYMTGTARTDSTWFPPNKRFLPYGLILPSQRNPAVGTLVAVIDSSGSIDDEQIRKLGTSVRGAAQMTDPELIVVLSCDSMVQSVQQFCRGEEIRIKAEGGGGTKFGPAFAKVAQLGLTPDCLVYLTDLDGRDVTSLRDPGYPVVWACTTERRGPFGETIKVS